MSASKTPKRAEPLFLVDRQPSQGELIVRAICGGLLGLAAATYLWLRVFYPTDSIALICALYLGSIGASVYLAVTRGDSFWERTASVFRWPF